MNEHLVFETLGSLSAAEESALNQIGAAVGKSNSLIGGEVVIQALVLTLTPIALKVIRDIALARIERGSKISFKTKDLEIKNVDRDTLLQLMNRLEDKGGNVDA